MSQPTTLLETHQRPQLSRLSTAVRGKLQFMDYLVRAAVADVERYQGETDPGTRIFIRQLVEMHTASLRQECQSLRMLGDLCSQLEALVNPSADPSETGEPE
jgi:hypothetical protein